jgi:hypothetical protein
VENVIEAHPASLSTSISIHLNLKNIYPTTPAETPYNSNMSDKLTANNPDDSMVIRELVPGVTTLSVPFARFGRIKFGGRATVGKYPTLHDPFIN